MDIKTRSHLISLAVMLFGVLLSGLFFFLSWVIAENSPWKQWLMLLSFAAFFGCMVIALLIHIGTNYNLPRGRAAGFMMVIAWIAISLLSTSLDTLSFLSEHTARGLSYFLVMGGLILLVLPGFLLILLPWPPKFLEPKEQTANNTHKV